MTNKYLAHVPVEQYGFLSIELEGTAEDAVAAYREIADLVKVQPKGMSEHEFRQLYDKVARGQQIQGDPGMLEECNPCQRFAINQAKLFVKRNPTNKSV